MSKLKFFGRELTKRDSREWVGMLPFGDVRAWVLCEGACQASFEVNGVPLVTGDGSDLQCALFDLEFKYRDYEEKLRRRAVKITLNLPGASR